MNSSSSAPFHSSMALRISIALVVTSLAPCVAGQEQPRPRVVGASAPFLDAIQADDGRFPARPVGRAVRDGEDLRATSLVCLAWLADGARSGMDRSGASLDLGLSWILAQQDGRGRIGLRGDPEWLVDHAMAATLLGEAAARHEDPKFAAGRERAIAFLATHLARFDASDMDVELSLWCEAAARTVPERAVEHPASRLAAEVRRHRPAAVVPVDDQRALAADFLLGRLLGEPPDEELRERVRTVATDGEDDLARFYALTALFRDDSESGRAAFRGVCRSLTTRLVARQQPGGSWAPAPGGDETLTTAVNVLMLTVYYRYCRLDLATGSVAR